MSKSIRSTLFLALLGAACLSPMALAQQHDMAAMMDADGNGSISAAEHASAAAAMFAKADADHDGNLTPAEMQAMHAGIEGHGMGHGMAHGAGHATAAAGPMACDCCAKAGKDGMAGCGMDAKQDPIGEAMSGDASHAGHAMPEADAAD